MGILAACLRGLEKNAFWRPCRHVLRSELPPLSWPPTSAVSAQRRLANCVQPRGTAALEEAAAEYATRINRYTAFEEVVVKPNPKNTTDPALQKEAEGERVSKLIAAGSRVVMLDERGKDISSEGAPMGLANLLAKAGDDGLPVVFVIGGPFGHGPQVRERADVTIRLSAMVMNHQVARLVLLEQIYRAWTIVKGEPYHH